MGTARLEDLLDFSTGAAGVANDAAAIDWAEVPPLHPKP